MLSLLDMPLLEYGHIPLALGKDGQKLSKQAGAIPLGNRQAASNLIAALRFLNHEPPVEVATSQSCSDLLAWAINSWRRFRVPRQLAG